MNFKIISCIHAERSADLIVVLAHPMVKLRKPKSVVFPNSRAGDTSFPREATQGLYMDSQVARRFLGTGEGFK
ncbi:MAG TPA: hypothetical protein VMB03_24320 [Bryobacteraceae bacterium]|nr:hypothetical protein [Bryobacteraceae bacterium]